MTDKPLLAFDSIHSSHVKPNNPTETVFGISKLNTLTI